METKTIKYLTTPPEGGKRPGSITFTSGEVAKYWNGPHMNAELAIGATAPCELELKVKPKENGQGNFEDLVVKSWGEPAKGKKEAKAGGGLSPEERRSILIQTLTNAACALHARDDATPEELRQHVMGTLRGFLKFHDHEVANPGGSATA